MRIRLPYRLPFDWEAIASFLALRAIPGVEAVTPWGYRRTVRLGAARGVLEVRPLPRENALEMEIPAALGGVREDVERRLRQLFDLDVDPEAVAGRLGRDPRLRARIRRLPGVRVPGAFDGFEMTVRAVLGQQVSVRGATTLAGRLVARCGETLPGIDGVERTFPTPEALAEADLSGLGITGARIRTISAIARATADGEVRLDADAPPASLDALRAIPGIGEWTAQYVAMRALRDPDAFPAGDLGVRRALARGGVLPSTREVERTAERWRPFRAYAVMLLWTGGDVTISGKRPKAG